MPETSTKPYLLRAIYEWCTDNGYTPYMAVTVDGSTRVPMEYVKNAEIVLNISFTATSGLKMDNDLIRFSARFGGISRNIEVPVANVMAIYAHENGRGMAFEAGGKAQNGEGAENMGEAAVDNTPASSSFPVPVSECSSTSTEECESDHEEDSNPSPHKARVIALSSYFHKKPAE